MSKQLHCIICGDEPRHHYADKSRSCLNQLNQKYLKNTESNKGMERMKNE